jgi:hypothetical protein
MHSLCTLCYKAADDYKFRPRTQVFRIEMNEEIAFLLRAPPLGDWRAWVRDWRALGLVAQDGSIIPGDHAPLLDGCPGNNEWFHVIIV